MKNVYLTTSNKPSKIYFHRLENRLEFSTGLPMSNSGSGSWVDLKNIYITSDEEIKEGDYVLQTNFEKTNIQVMKCITSLQTQIANSTDGSFTKNKIILTTDLDLITDSVQAIGDDFLEWFVKNPSCKEVEVNGYKLHSGSAIYKIIIPIEDPKIETLEEAALRLYPISIEDDPTKDSNKEYRGIWIAGAKWQKEQNDWNLVSEKTPPINITVLAKSPHGTVHLTGWREAYSIFSCQSKRESSSDWEWKEIKLKNE